MPRADPPLPPVRVILPDGQELRGRLHAKQQFERGGWMYWVGLLMWSNVPEIEGAEPAEYRVWLTPAQAQPITGVSYGAVPKIYLHREAPTAQDAGRWVFKVQQVAALDRGPAGLVVHVSDCEEAPADGAALSVLEALEVLRRPGAVTCEECQTDVALGPLV